MVPKFAVTPLGKPEADNVTAPVKPPVSVTLTVSVAVDPWFIATDAGEAANVNPAVPFPVVNAKVAE